MTGPITIDSLDGPGKVGGVCAIGIRRGAQWLKTSVELGPSTSTVIVLGRPDGGGPIRIRLGDASAVLDTPPR